MKCPKCQFDNIEGAKFCNECGVKLETACPTCGRTNPPGSKFCNGCGHNLRKTPGPTWIFAFRRRGMAETYNLHWK